MKIKYDLQVFHNIVLFKVLEMDEKYRNRGNKISKLFNSTNKMDICSESCVGLYDEAIYVIGKHFEEEDTTDLIRFSTSKEAQEYADKIKFALEEWNNYVEIMEIEWSDSEMSIKNEDYEVIYQYYVDDYGITEDIAIFKGDYLVIAYNITDIITLDKLIKMFNYNSELLNIPFWIKGAN